MYEYLKSKKLVAPTTNTNTAMQVEGDTHHSKQELPWVEKYRPNTIDGLVYQQEVKRSLSGVIKSGNLPNLLLYGPAGTGKTSAIIAMVKQLYGPGYSKRVLELNASDDRGIKVVRTKIKSFAQYKSVGDNEGGIGYNVIILDEADSMTTDAQSALRRIMEDFSKTVRFAIICNFVTKIIEPIASRCVKFRFKSIPEQHQIAKLQQICNQENLKVNQQTLKSLLSNGDLRKSINTLQTLQGIDIIPEIIPTPQYRFGQIFQAFRSMKDVHEVARFSKEVLREQIPFDELLMGMMKQFMKIDNSLKLAKIMKILAATEEKIMLGCGDVQIIELFTTTFFILHQADRF